MPYQLYYHHQIDKLNYYNKRTDKEFINPKIQKFLLTVYEQIAKDGIDKVVTR